MISELRAGILAILLVIALGLFDHATSPQLGLGILYFVPVAFAAWKVNRATGLAVAAVATGAWAIVDTFSGFPYSSPWYALWNAGARAASFVVIALLVSALCRQKEQQIAINERLRESIAETERASSRINELQNELQLICSWTNRIRSEGRWMRFEEFMQRNFNMTFTHGMSEEAAKRMTADVERSLGQFDPPSDQR